MLSTLLLCAMMLSSGSSAMWGISQKSALVTIDLTDGTMSAQTKQHADFLEAQELSAIDTALSRYYTMGVNSTSGAVELFVWSLDSYEGRVRTQPPGHAIKGVLLPFKSSPLVGVGQALSVDPTDSTIIAMGHDPKRAGHHCIYKIDPSTFEKRAGAQQHAPDPPQAPWRPPAGV